MTTSDIFKMIKKPLLAGALLTLYDVIIDGKNVSMNSLMDGLTLGGSVLVSDTIVKILDVQQFDSNGLPKDIMEKILGPLISAFLY